MPADSTHNRIGASLARANLRVNQAIGIQISYQHRKELPVPIYARPLERGSDDEDIPLGRRVDVQTHKLLIPVQDPAWSGSSGFSGSWNVEPSFSGLNGQPSYGDKVLYPIFGTETYYVEGPVEIINNGYAYVLTIVQHKTTALGEKQSGL
jgi:hypothetical protein